MAEIQFTQGVAETVVPDIRVTRSKDGTQGRAIFYFDQPDALKSDSTNEITGLYLVDEEGQMVSREVKAKFVNGQPEAIEAILLMKSLDEWERFLRFMNRYGEQNGLEFTKS